MAWQETMVVMLRRMVGDTARPYRNTDAALEESLCVGTRLVLMEIAFPIRYDADPVNVDIIPDPTEGDTRDDNFVNLVCARTAAMLDQGAALAAAGQAIMIQDGSSRVDLRETFKARLALLQKGWMAVYEKMRDDYLVSGYTGVGGGIVSSFGVRGGC